MLNRLDLRGVADPSGRLPRPSVDGDEPLAAVRSIIAAVRDRGDDALRERTSELDGVELDELAVPADEVSAALDSVGPEVRAALELADARIAEHHRAQLRDEGAHECDGVHLRSKIRPGGRVGCYVRGGRAAYASISRARRGQWYFAAGASVRSRSSATVWRNRTGIAASSSIRASIAASAKAR